MLHFNKYHKQLDSLSVNLTDESCRCPVCGMLFANSANMRRHKTQAHKHSDSVSQLFNNSINASLLSLDASFDSMNGNSSLGETRTYLCQRINCGKLFGTALDLRRHLNREHKRNATVISNDEICDFCGTTFNCMIDLEEHMRSVHYMEEETDIPVIDTQLNEIPLNPNIYDSALVSFDESSTLRSILSSTTIEQNNENTTILNNILTNIKVEPL